MDWDYMMSGWSGGGWMWVAMALFLALVALGTVAVVRATTKGASPEVDKR